MILIALNPAWVPRLDGTAGGTALPFPSRKYMLSQVEPGTIEPSCVIASGVSEMGALQSRTLMGARKPSTRRLYASNWSVCEGVRLISTRLLAPYVMRTPRLQFAPSVFLRFYIDRSSSFRQSIQLLGAMVGVRTAEPYRN